MATKKTKTKFGWGGARVGSGRPKSPDSGVPHTARAKVKRGDAIRLFYALDKKHPATKKRIALHDVVFESAQQADGRFGVQINEAYVDIEKMRVVIEAKVSKRDANTSSAAQGLAVRIARGVNRAMNVSGKLFSDRYQLERA